MTREMMDKLMEAALEELGAAIGKLREQTTPYTPLPRPRVFEFAPGLRWPITGSGGKKRIDLNQAEFIAPGSYYTYTLHHASDRRNYAVLLCEAVGYKPRAVLRALRRIQAATEWCRRRAEGRRRAAEEILRQQAKAVEALEAERVLQGLKGR